jgi:hypothetical protein
MTKNMHLFEGCAKGRNHFGGVVESMGSSGKNFGAIALYEHLIYFNRVIVLFRLVINQPPNDSAPQPQPPNIRSDGQTEENESKTVHQNGRVIHPSPSKLPSCSPPLVIYICRKDTTGSARTRIPSRTTTSSTLPLRMTSTGAHTIPHSLTREKSQSLRT